MCKGCRLGFEFQAYCLNSQVQGLNPEPEIATSSFNRSKKKWWKPVM